MAQPKRLYGISYTGPAAYFVTSVTHERVRAFDNIDFGPFAAAALIDASRRFDFELSAYVLMPDHAHFLLSSSDDHADLRAMVKAWKQRTGFDWSRRRGVKLWQHGYWERVLRDSDDPLSVCRYIVENPVRSRLVAHPREYPLCGSTRFTIDEICAAVQMSGWWRAD